jgi:hypothetical protein
MAKATVVHSDDAATIIFKGDRRRPEPSTGIIKFPGGHVEVTRCSDNTYWAHIAVCDGVNIVDSRVDRAGRPGSVQDMPDAAAINHIALRVANTVPHFDPDA